MFKRMKAWYGERVGRPAGATVNGWRQWEKETKTKHPFKYLMFETVPTFFRRYIKRLKNLKYHFKQKYFFGYHYLKLDVKRFKEPYNNNQMDKYSWMDADTQLELFSFQILVNYIENEIGLDEFKTRIFEYGPSWYDKEAYDLYQWFVNDYCDDTYDRLLQEELDQKYPDQDEFDKLTFFSEPPKSERERQYREDWSELHEKIRQRDIKLGKEMTENLIRLIKIRGALWT